MFVLALASRHQSSLSRAVADCGRFAALVGSVASCRHRLVRHNADEKGPAPKAITHQASRSAIWCRPELAEIGALDVSEVQRVLEIHEINWLCEVTEKASGGRRRHSSHSRSGNAARFDLAGGFEVFPGIPNPGADRDAIAMRSKRGICRKSMVLAKTPQRGRSASTLSATRPGWRVALAQATGSLYLDSLGQKRLLSSLARV